MRGTEPSITGRGILIGAYHPESGDHLCSVWTDPVRDRRAAARFLQGAGEGEAAVWVQDPSREHLPAHLEGDARALRAFSTRDVHLAEGHFDPERMFRFWRDRAGESQARSVRHTRAIAEMAWALEERPGTEQAAAFEAALNTVLAPLPVSVICQYGSIRFRPQLILAMLLSHPRIVIGERVFSNPFFVPGEEFASRLALLSGDPVGALVPIWRHFLHRLPTAGEAAAFLCNSLLMFIPVEAVTVQLQGQPGPSVLDALSERLEEGVPLGPPGAAWSRLFAVWPSSTGIVGGSLYTAARGDYMTAEATFESDRGSIVLAARGAFTPTVLMLFTALASDVGTALAGLPHRGDRQSLEPVS